MAAISASQYSSPVAESPPESPGAGAELGAAADGLVPLSGEPPPSPPQPDSPMQNTAATTVSQVPGLLRISRFTSLSSRRPERRAGWYAQDGDGKHGTRLRPRLSASRQFDPGAGGAPT